MKKFIAVSAALVLVAGSAFAEWDLGARVQFGADLAAGNNVDGSEVIGRQRNAQVVLFGDITRDTTIGTMGASYWLQFDDNMNRLDITVNADGDPRLGLWAGGVAWWRPIDMLWLGLGNDHGQLDNIARSGDNAHRDLGIIATGAGAGVSRINLDTGFYRGMGEGFIFDLTPGDMVEFGGGVPYPIFRNAVDVDPDNIGDLLSGSHGRLRINLDGIGRIGFAYAGSSAANSNGSIFASFHTPASDGLVDGVAINLGVGFHLVEGAQRLDIGFGAGWNLAQDFGVGFRGAVSIGLDHDGSDNATTMGFEVLPRFVLLEGVRLHVPIQFGLALSDSDVLDNLIAWRVHPYVAVNLTGNVGFVGGFNIGGNDDRGRDRPTQNTLDWAIPIGMRVQF